MHAPDLEENGNLAEDHLARCKLHTMVVDPIGTRR